MKSRPCQLRISLLAKERVTTTHSPEITRVTEISVTKLMRAIFVLFSLVLFVGCGSDPKAELLKEVSSVWRDNSGILWAFDLTTPNSMFEMTMGDQKMASSIAIDSVDTEKAVVVLKFVRPDKQEKILTLKKVVTDEQKKEFHLLLTRDDGVQDTLTHIRDLAPGTITSK